MYMKFVSLKEAIICFERLFPILVQLASNPKVQASNDNVCEQGLSTVTSALSVWFKRNNVRPFLRTNSVLAPL
jgi:hypothetical protein